MRKHNRKDKAGLPYGVQKKRREEQMLPTGPGHRLRLAREKLEISRDEIAKGLRLTKACIIDIERDEYKLGTPFIFIRGYLRAYAKLVSLPPDEIVSAFEELDIFDSRPETVWLDTKNEEGLANRSAKWLAYGVACGLVLLLFFWWQTQRVIDADGVGFQTESIGSDFLSSEVPPLEIQQEQVSSDSHQSKATLQLTFSDHCWIEIYDRSQQEVFVGLKRKGETLQLEGESPFEVLLGNPKAVELSLNNTIYDLTSFTNKQTARLTLG